MAVAQSKLAAAQKHEGITTASAATSLRRFKRQMIPGINPECQTQLRAYITLRETHARVNPQQFLNYLKSLSTSVSTGAETYQDFWAAPKGTFASVMPTAIEDALVDPLRCEGLMIDHDLF